VTSHRSVPGVVEQVRFEGGDATEAPAGNGESVNEIRFDGAGGLILGEVGLEECVEVLLGFAGQRVEFSGQPVFAGILRGSGFALGGDGASGFGAVGAGGVGFGFRCHAQG
jgi:hypothetical protein